MPFPPLVLKAGPPRARSWRTQRYQQQPPPKVQLASSQQMGGRVVANESNSTAEVFPSLQQQQRRRGSRTQPALAQSRHDFASSLNRLDRHNAALLKENSILKARVEELETKLQNSSTSTGGNSTTGDATVAETQAKSAVTDVKVLQIVGTNLHVDPALDLILQKVAETATEFVGTLVSFLGNKKGIERVRRQHAPAGLLDAVEMAAIGIMLDGEFDMARFQTGMDGITPIQSTDELYEVAGTVESDFYVFLNDTKVAVVGEGSDITVKQPPTGLKKPERAEKKAKDDYLKRPAPESSSTTTGFCPAIGWVFDIVRGTLSCKTADLMIKVVEQLKKDPRMKSVIKFKNRFQYPTANGFSDFLIQFVFQSGSLQHNCELQIHLEQVTQYAVANNSHASYDYFRHFFYGSMKTVAKKMFELETIVGPDFVVGSEAGKDVLRGLVVDVVHSRDTGRMDAFATLFADLLEEFDLAIYILNAKLKVEKETKGKDCNAVGHTYSGLAKALMSKGEYDASKVMHKKAVAINKASVARSHNELGHVLRLQGQYEPAMHMFQAAKKILVEVFGGESGGGSGGGGEVHADIATSYFGMGAVLWKQGKAAESLEKHEKALAIRIKVSTGGESKEVAESYHGMGNVHNDLQKEYTKALEMYEKAAGIKIRVFGAEHADVAASYNNMANVYKRQGDSVRALELYTKTLAIYLKALGPNHPDVASSYNNLAAVYYGQEDYVKALELYEKAVTIKLKALGPDHPDVASSYNNMAAVYDEQEDYVKALELYEKALAIRLKAFGPDHPSVASSYNNMGNVYCNQQDWTKALDYCERALKIYKASLGDDHADTKSTASFIRIVKRKLDNLALPHAIPYIKSFPSPRVKPTFVRSQPELCSHNALSSPQVTATVVHNALPPVVSCSSSSPVVTVVSCSSSSPESSANPK